MSQNGSHITKFMRIILYKSNYEEEHIILWRFWSRNSESWKEDIKRRQSHYGILINLKALDAHTLDYSCFKLQAASHHPINCPIPQHCYSCRIMSLVSIILFNIKWDLNKVTKPYKCQNPASWLYFSLVLNWLALLFTFNLAVPWLILFSKFWN